MKVLSRIKPFLFFLLCCTAWSAVCFVLPFFIDNPVESFNGILLLVGYCIAVSFGIFVLLYLAAANRYVFALFFPIFCVLGAVVAYFRYAFKATITPMIIDASLHNDFQTTYELITVPLVLFVLLNLIVSIAAVSYRWRKITVKNAWLHIFIAMAMLLLLFNVSSRLKSSLMQRYPFNVYESFMIYRELQQKIAEDRICPDMQHYNCTDSLKVVLVIGESLRADHLSLNGYSRQTMPYLSQQTNLVSLSDVYSEYTYTNRSVPHILTRADSITENLAFNETSFITIFNNAGFQSAWISCQDPAYSYVAFTAECDTLIYTHPEKSVYVYSDWFDNEMLTPFDSLSLKGTPRQLTVFHMIGSHWYYNNHVLTECERFKPVTTNRTVTANTAEAIINSYDNTVVTADLFLHQLFCRLEQEKAIVIFLSDHGEILGENGQWLHASDNEVVRHPACLVWYSNAYKTTYPQKVAALKQNATLHYRTDFLFHSILSAANIPSPIIDDNLNIFSCHK